MSNNRKNDHINLALDLFKQNEGKNNFEDFFIVHNSLSTTNYEDVDISTNIFNTHFPKPFYINAMTGGSKTAYEVNKKLATLARETNLMMATGSLSAALRDPQHIPSFKVVREVNPHGFILANLGAERSLEDAKKAIEIIDADALQIHVNIPQEMTMPEGDRNFENYKDNINYLINDIDLPVIVKEVGFGMNREVIKELYEMGAQYVDISGAGGTSFISIENARRQQSEFTYLNDYGIKTGISLLEAQDYIDKLNVLASGGIKTALDIVKCLSLGAKACGMSAYFLNLIMNNDLETAISKVNNLAEEIKVLMTIFDAKNIKALKKLDLIISGETKAWCEARNIDYKHFANRNQ